MSRKKRDQNIITDIEKAFAILVMSKEFTMSKAYMITHPDNKQEHAAMYSNRIWNTPRVQEFAKKKEEEKKGFKIEKGDEDKYNIEKEDLIISLSKMFKEVTEPKLKAEIGMKIADLKDFKKEQSDKAKQMHYYLQVKCESCPFKSRKVN